MKESEIPENFPVPLREAVEKYLVEHGHSKLLTTRVYAGTPYKDKSVTVTYHQAYLQWGNLLTVLTHDDDIGLWTSVSYMTVGDIQVFLKHSDFFK